MSSAISIPSVADFLPDANRRVDFKQQAYFVFVGNIRTAAVAHQAFLLVVI